MPKSRKSADIFAKKRAGQVVIFRYHRNLNEKPPIDPSSRFFPSRPQLQGKGGRGSTWSFHTPKPAVTYQQILWERKSVRKSLPLLAIALAGLGTAGQAATIVDSSFETPTIAHATFSYDPVVSGARFVGDAGVVSNGSSMNLAPAPDGTQMAFLQGYAGANGSFSVDVSGLVAGAPYVLSFLAARGSTFGALGVDPFTVSFNGTQIGSFSAVSSIFSLFSTQAFIPTGTTGTLTFTGSHTTANTLVAIDDLSFGAVPEPKSWAMMLIGFAVAGMSLRSRARKRPQPA